MNARNLIISLVSFIYLKIVALCSGKANFLKKLILLRDFRILMVSLKVV